MNERIVVRAESQHGVVARFQLVADGISDSLVRSRIRRGFLRPRHRGVYAVGHSVLSRYGIWLAAVLACGPRGVLSHGSAAALWGFAPVRSPIQVTRTTGRRASIGGVEVHRSRQLTARDLTVENSIPVTTVERTLVDCAAQLSERQLERMLVEADRTGLLNWNGLASLTRQRLTIGGVPTLRRVMDRTDPAAIETAAPGEIDFLSLCAKAELPLPQVNPLVEGLRVDFLWPEHFLVVEIDGYEFHRDRLAFEEDRRRDAVLTACGYTVLRFTYRMLREQPEWVLAQVRSGLGRGA